jgi:hypothetical protein
MLAKPWFMKKHGFLMTLTLFVFLDEEDEPDECQGRAEIRGHPRRNRRTWVTFSESETSKSPSWFMKVELGPSNTFHS